MWLPFGARQTIKAAPGPTAKTVKVLGTWPTFAACYGPSRAGISLPIDFVIELRKSANRKGQRDERWWLQRDSNPCFSLERAETRTVVPRTYEPVATGGCHPTFE